MPGKNTGGNLPLFLSHTQRERDEFVRALGISDYDDMNFLNLLCSYAAKRRVARVHVPDLLSAVASWARSHGKPNLMGGSAKGTFRRVLTVLERNGYASTKDDPNWIVLRDGDRRAGRGERAVAEIDKVYRVFESDPLQSFPSSADVQIPATALETVGHADFTADLVASRGDSPKILRITFAENLDILVTPTVLPRLLDVARRRVHFYIQNNPNLYNFVLFELRKIPQFRHLVDQQRLYTYLENRTETPPLFWVYLGLAVARSRNEDLLEPKYRQGRTPLLESAYLLHGYWQNQHSIEQQRKQRDADHSAVITWLERADRGYTIEEIADTRDEGGKPLREKYTDARGFVEEALEKQRAEAETAGRVPPIVFFGDLWMHHRLVLSALREEIKNGALFCERAIETEWKAKLEQGEVSEPALNDDEAFGAALRSLTESRCPHLTTMLKKPRLVHLIITEAAEKDPGLFRVHGALFEGLDDPTFRRMDQLLSLDRAEILGRLIAGLSLLRRFLLRRRFRTHRPAPKAPPQTRDPGRTEAPSGEPPQPGGGAPTVMVTRPRHVKPQTVTVQRPSKTKKGPKTVDEAMVKLREAMHKRPPR